MAKKIFLLFFVILYIQDISIKSVIFSVLLDFHTIPIN